MPLFLIFLIFFYAPLCSQDTNASLQTEILDPANLSRTWWEDTAQAINDKKSAEEFSASLKRQVDSLSQENQPAAQKLIEEIAQNFQILLDVSSKNKFIEPINPIAATYNLDRLMEVHHHLLKNQIELQITEEDQEQKSLLINKIQESLDKLILRYDKTYPHSEKKFLTGLEWIATRTKLEANKKTLTLLNQNFESLKTALNQRLSEEDYAKYHLVSNQTELVKFEKQATEAKKKWDSKKKQLNTKDTNFMSMTLLNSCDEDEVKKQLAILQGFELTLDESNAHLRYIQSSLLANLSRLMLQNLDEKSIETFNTELKEWKSSLEGIEKSSGEWRKRLETIIQRNEQIHCLSEPSTATSRTAAALNEEFIAASKKNLQLVSMLENELIDTSFLYATYQSHLIPLLGHHRQWLAHFSSFVTTSYESVNQWIDHTLFHVGNYPVTLLGLLRFAFILFLTFLIARLVVNMLNRLGEKRRGLQQSVLYKINRLVNYLILFIGFLVALSSIGFDFSNLLLVAGALGVGLGFGLQSIFNNFISGIIILFENNLKVGDLIELENGVRGDVRAINFRSTVLRTPDGIEALIPNAELVTSKVMNWTLNDPYRRMHIPFSIAYGEDKAKVVRLITEAAKKESMTLIRPGIPEPSVALVKFGENGLEFELNVWIDDRTSRTKNILSTYLWLIETILSENGVSMPFPQREIRIITSTGEKKIPLE